jgi:hypothetical protein
MHMLDWNRYRQQLVAGVGGFGRLNPDIVRGYATLSRAGQKAGHLDEKTRELKCWAWRSPSTPAPPSSIPPARSTHSTPLRKSNPPPELMMLSHDFR